MEAHAARSRPVGRRWRHALESRRVLAPLLIAPAVVFMALVVGVPFVWAIYLSFTDAIGGSLSGHWVGFDNFANAWHDENFRRALRNTLIFTVASQAIVVVGAAVLSNFLVRDFRGKWIIRFLVVLPWAAPVVLSTITWLWLLDSLYSVLNWTLAELHLDHRSYGCSARCTSSRTPRCRCSGSAARTLHSSRSRSCMRGGSSPSRS